MKKITILLCCCAAILSFSKCSVIAIDLGDFHKKAAAPATTRRTPAEEIAYAKTNFTDSQRAAGEVIFEKTCAGCHDLPDVSDYTVHELDDILPKMFRKGKLSYDDAGLVKAYIVVNAKGE